MDDNLIPLSMLNDYIFCPYSIYLHNIYMGTDEGKPQSVYVKVDINIIGYKKLASFGLLQWGIFVFYFYCYVMKNQYFCNGFF